MLMPGAVSQCRYQVCMLHEEAGFLELVQYVWTADTTGDAGRGIWDGGLWTETEALVCLTQE